MAKTTKHNEGGIGGTLKNSLSKLTERVTLKAPPASEQPKAKAAKPVKPSTPKPMSPPEARRKAPSPAPQKSQPATKPAPKTNAAAAKPAPAPTAQSTPKKTPAAAPSTPSPAATANVASNALANDVLIEGTLRFADNLVFDGRLKGEITSNGALSLHPNAVVEAAISVKTLIIAGKVVGNITATESVHLAASAVVVGDITTGSLTMEPNASFQGQGKIGQPTQGAAKAKPQPSAQPSAGEKAPKSAVDVPPAPAPNNKEEAKNDRAA